MNSTFKKSYSSRDRWNESTRVLEKYPDRTPIICERSKSAGADCPFIDKNKYLVPNGLSVGQFIYIIRKRMNLPSEKALFLFINGTIPPTSSMIGSVYACHKDSDGFLYVTYSLENTFG
jgi:GABA(A) receptor-associated protein